MPSTKHLRVNRYRWNNSASKFPTFKFYIDCVIQDENFEQNFETQLAFIANHLKNQTVIVLFRRFTKMRSQTTVTGY